jgi:hypothetical protein
MKRREDQAPGALLLGDRLFFSLLVLLVIDLLCQTRNLDFPYVIVRDGKRNPGRVLISCQNRRNRWWVRLLCMVWWGSAGRGAILYRREERFA